MRLLWITPKNDTALGRHSKGNKDLGQIHVIPDPTYKTHCFVYLGESALSVAVQPRVSLCRHLLRFNVRSSARSIFRVHKFSVILSVHRILGLSSGRFSSGVSSLTDLTTRWSCLLTLVAHLYLSDYLLFSLYLAGYIVLQLWYLCTYCD